MASGVKLNTTGGRIIETGSPVSNERSFEYPVSLASGTLYLSFLARRSASGAFVIETDNADGRIRFGVSVDKDGYAGVRAGLVDAVSNAVLFEEDATYFVLVKFTNQGSFNAISRIKLFKKGEDMVPEEDTNIA